MPSRIWLDATTEQLPQKHLHEEKPRTSSYPPVPALPIAPPVIPPRHHSPAHSSASESRSRSRSLAAKARAKQNRREKIDSKAAPSPELIGNLIDSLASLSFPDPTEADRLSPHSRQNRLSAVSSAAPSPQVLRNSVSFDDNPSPVARDFGSLRDALKDQLADVDDAAEPPVVRTAKPPSGWGIIGPNKLRKGSGSTEGHSGLGISGTVPVHGFSRQPSNASLPSVANSDDNRGFAVTRRASSLISTSIEETDGRLTPTKRKPFKWSSSPVRKPTRTPSKQPSAELRMSALQVDDIKSPIGEFQEPTLDWQFSLNSPQAPAGTKREGKKPARSRNPSPAISQGPAIPDRRSSAKNHELIVETPKAMGCVPSREASVADSKERQPFLAEEEPKTLTTIDLMNGEDTEVTKRIRELKAKKEQREREARESPTPEMTPVKMNGVMNGVNSVTAPKNGLLNTIPKKVRKVPAQITLPGVKSKANENDYLTSLLEAPSTPLTPMALPINYSFVVQSLDQTRPASRTGSKDDLSVKRLSKRSKDDLSVKKPSQSSAAFGGRSATSRALVGKSYTDTVPGAQTPHRSQSTERSFSQRGQSPAPTPQGRSSSRARRSSSVTARRKRWSHPDLPTGLERRSSLKATIFQKRDALPKEPQEERPSTADSIARAVDTFICAQRLSQRIRHPQTGRVISFSEVGNPKGNAVFCCVGMGLTRYVMAFYDELASTLNLRLITPDRPGVGESETDPNGTPLSWPDDVLLICSALNITKFSMLAHSAGAIYALATALRVPQHIRGKVHLLAPWIPPSQMETIGTHQDPPPGTQLPKSQRFLRVLPAPLLKVANSSFLSATSASLSPNLGNQSRKKSKNIPIREASPSATSTHSTPTKTPSRPQRTRRESIMLMDQQSMPKTTHTQPPQLTPPHRLSTIASPRTEPAHARSVSAPLTPSTATFDAATLSRIAHDPALRRLYDEHLTASIWAAATTAANPAVDLLVCLERSQTIGFRYVDITRSVVIHHGSRDSRVPVDNVRWIGGRMRRCEVRVLEGESHGLMASAAVMGGVLTEVAGEWREWERVVGRGRGV